MLCVRLMVLLIMLALGAGGMWPAGAQEPRDLNQMLIASYDLLEAGKIDEAQAIYEQILKQDPTNPLALNNLAAIMFNKGKYEEALAHLNRALPRAKGYRVMVNRVCDVGGACMAFRPPDPVYGDMELEPLIRGNLAVIKAAQAAGKKK